MSIGDLPAYLFALTPARVVFLPALGGAGATLAVAVRDGRRRTALNECLHELRRPLQALVLLAPGGSRGASADGSVEMAAEALARLEREINGEADVVRAREAFAARPLLESAVRRWRSQAALRGKSLALRWDADEAVVEGDRFALAAALDNLLANALEHGGERIELAADLAAGRICLAVVDSGNGAGRRARDRDTGLRGREAKRRQEARRPFRRLSGRARHGHGLRLVRRTAAEHGGSFALHRGERGTSAVLELPLAPSRWSEPLPFADRGSEGRSVAGADPDAGRAPALSSRPEIVIRREGR